MLLKGQASEMGYPHLSALSISGGIGARVRCVCLWPEGFWIPSLALLITGTERKWLHPQTLVSIYCVLDTVLGALKNMMEVLQPELGRQADCGGAEDPTGVCAGPREW